MGHDWRSLYYYTSAASGGIALLYMLRGRESRRGESLEEGIPAGEEALGDRAEPETCLEEGNPGCSCSSKSPAAEERTGVVVVVVLLW